MGKIFKSKTTYLIIFLLFSVYFLGPEKVLSFVFGSESNVAQWIRENTIIRLRIETDDVRMGASNTLFVDTSENKLGVGTDAPSSTLSVIGNSFVAGVSTTTTQYINSLTTNYLPYASTSGLLSNSGLYWDNSNTRLGIGTTNTQQTLNVNGSIYFPSSDYKITWISGQIGDWYLKANEWKVNTSIALKATHGSQGAITFHTGGSATERMRITAGDLGGYVGIGTTTPAYTLDVVGTINSSSTTTTKAMGVGLSQTGTTPKQPLDVSGNINITQVVQPANTFTLTGTTGGALDDGAVYKYSIAFVTAVGDTSCSGDTGGGTSGKEVTLAAGQNAVLIENIPVSVDPRVTGRRIYRSDGGGSVATGGSILINNNTATSYTDLIADGSLSTAYGTMYRKDNLTTRGIYVNNVLMAALNTWNSGLGYDILTHLTTGRENFALGKYCLHGVTSGNDNVGIGVNAYSEITTGNSNIGIGYSAGYLNTAGNNNVSIGDGAGRMVSTGNMSGNVAVGSSALREHIGGNDYNTGIGYEAGLSFRGSKNLFLGFRAGRLAVATSVGNYNILIGSEVGDNAAAGADGNILIGKQLDLPVANGDNQLSIGNLIFGTGLDGTGTTVSSGNIGIGTTTPTAILHLKAGTVTAPLKFTSGTLLNTPEDGAVEYDGANFYLTTGATRKTITTSTGGSANKASCWKADGTLGYCSDAVGVDGSCTCN